MKKNAKKLSLALETLKNISKSDLKDAAGGFTARCHQTDACPTALNTCRCHQTDVCKSALFSGCC